jgi:hypothetical protein
VGTGLPLQDGKRARQTGTLIVRYRYSSNRVSVTLEKRKLNKQELLMSGIDD